MWMHHHRLFLNPHCDYSLCCCIDWIDLDYCCCCEVDDVADAVVVAAGGGGDCDGEIY